MSERDEHEDGADEQAPWLTEAAWRELRGEAEEEEEG